MKFLSTKFLSVLSLFFFLVTSHPAGASYPTVWRIVNSTNVTLYVECCNPAAGLYQPIVMGSSAIGQGSSFTYTWNGWHNDGMGLNPGTWSCVADIEPRPLSRPALRRSQFRSDWGENLSLEVRGDSQGYAVYKN